MRTLSGSTLPPSYVIDQLLKYRRMEFIRGWYNTVLGETYDKGDVRLTDAILNPLFKSERGTLLLSPMVRWC